MYYSGMEDITRVEELLFEKNHYKEMGISSSILK